MEITDKIIEDLSSELICICDVYQERYDLENYRIIKSLGKVEDHYSSDYDD
jgi:hypothetical protein